MSRTPEPSSPLLRPRRSRIAVTGERAFELVIRVCGVSAIVLVFGIFFFVAREALPILLSPNFNLREFLFSIEWYPTSVTDVRYGVAAMLVGTLSVTAFAMLLAVPFGLGAASLRVGVLRAQT